jgi:predicted kinase
VLNERAEAVVRALGAGPVSGAEVAAAVVAHGPNLGSQLLRRVGQDGGEPWPELVDVGELVAHAEAEAARLGSLRAGCEHLVLGSYGLTRDPVLGRVRLALQQLAADRAYAGYRSLAPREPKPARTPVVVVIAGLPGSGKTTLAEETAVALRAPVYSLDWLLGALTPFGLVRADNAEPLGDQLICAAVGRQVQLGLDVVVDTVGHEQDGRTRLRELVRGLGGVPVEVECVVPDQAVHQSRVDGRARGIPGWPGTVSWDHVNWMRDRWEDWPESHLLVDTTAALDSCLARVLAAVESAR